MNLLNTDPKNLQMKFVTGELQGLRDVISYLYDGEQGAFNALLFIKSNYKQWPEILIWLKDRRMRGKVLVEFFQNESPDGGGYHMGVTKILSMMKGMKFSTEGIKMDELL